MDFLNRENEDPPRTHTETLAQRNTVVKIEESQRANRWKYGVDYEANSCIK